MSREQLEVMLADTTLGEAIQVGTLSCDRRGAHEAISFSYTSAWLAAKWAFAIDPELPLGTGSFYPGAGRSLFGVFRDTAPDRWGRVLMERREAMEAREMDRKVRRLTDWDFLTGVSDTTRMGALRLREPDGDRRYVDPRARGAPPAARLRELEVIARELGKEGVEKRPEYVQWLRQLLAPGTSLGGARPKATFSTEGGDLWLAKFPAHDDRRDVGAWEYLAYTLAGAAGVDMPPAELYRFGNEYRTFAVKRFDREQGTRRLYASAMTLLGLNDGAEGSYLGIAQAIQDLGDPARIAADLEQLYRRILFSILIGNRDDHFRNHGFLRSPGGWRLAPAFDINPNPDKAVHALAIDEADPRPSVMNLRITAPYYRLQPDHAERIEVQVRDAVADWRTHARALGLTGAALSQLEGVIGETRA